MSLLSNKTSKELGVLKIGVDAGTPVNACRPSPGDKWPYLLDKYSSVFNGPTRWLSPLVAVEKPNVDVRICIDMRQPNQAIICERHPVPTVEETIQEMSGGKVFSKLDLNMAYHQVELHPDSREIATFAGPDGLYRYK